jgi:hypothetical protein
VPAVRVLTRTGPPTVAPGSAHVTPIMLNGRVRGRATLGPLNATI